MSLRSTSSRNYSRNNFGELQNFCTFGAFALFLASVVVGLLNNSVLFADFRVFANSQISYPTEYSDSVRSLESQPFAFDHPVGTIDYKIKFGDAPEVKAKLTFSDERTVYRSFVLDNGMEMHGSANYSLTGSVIKYSDVSGDKYLFSEIGSPLYAIEGMTFIELDGAVRIALVTDAPAADIEHPILLADKRSMIDKLRSLSILKLLQLCLMSLGVLMLMYILVRINLFPGDRKRSVIQKNKLAA